MEEEKNKGGRPTKFNKDIENFAKYLYREKNKTDKEVAEIIGVDESTINNWKKRHGKFFESIKECKEFADHKVEASLFERANGYSHEEEKIFVRPAGGNKELYTAVNDLAKELGLDSEEIHKALEKSGNYEREDVVRAITNKQYPPDPTSCIFWLTNRQPKKWKHKQSVEHSGEVTINFDKEDEKL